MAGYGFFCGFLTLDLQPLLDGIYALGRYDERIDYSRPLPTAWSEVEVARVQDLLKSRPLQARTKRCNRP